MTDYWAELFSEIIVIDPRSYLREESLPELVAEYDIDMALFLYHQKRKGPFQKESSVAFTAAEHRLPKNLPSRRFRREEKCERKPSGFPFAFNNPPQRQNCKIILQNFILQF